MCCIFTESLQAMLFSSTFVVVVMYTWKEIFTKKIFNINSFLNTILYARLNGMQIYYKNKLWHEFLDKLCINILRTFFHVKIYNISLFNNLKVQVFYCKYHFEKWVMKTLYIFSYSCLFYYHKRCQFSLRLFNPCQKRGKYLSIWWNPRSSCVNYKYKSRIIM